MSGGNRIRRHVTLLGSVIALAAVAGLAGAQVPTKPVPKDTVTKKQITKPTSTQRVKIQKEQKAGGEVVTVTQPCEVVDSAAIRADQRSLDSISNAAQLGRVRSQMQNEADRRVAETRAQLLADQRAKDEAAAIALRRHLARGWYIGGAGGFSTPMRSTRNTYTGGYNFTVPVGYDWQDSPFGLRVDFSADHLNGTRFQNAQATTISASGDITMWSVNGDLKIRIPAPGGNTRTHFYAITGVGAGRVSGGVYGASGPQAGQTLSFSSAHTNFVWNAGGGVAFQWGPAEIFAESRFMQMKTDLPYWSNGGLSDYTSYTPIVIGVTWF